MKIMKGTLMVHQLTLSIAAIAIVSWLWRPTREDLGSTVSMSLEHVPSIRSRESLGWYGPQPLAGTTFFQKFGWQLFSFHLLHFAIDSDELRFVGPGRPIEMANAEACSPTSKVCFVCSITNLAALMPSFTYLIAATAPTSIVTYACP